MNQYTIKAKYATTIALDQHARSVTLAGIDLVTGEERTGRLSNCPKPEDIVKWALDWAHEPFRFVYESGPCGFELARRLRELGHTCDIITVSSIPRNTKSKVFKDDRGDASALLSAVIAPKSQCRVVYIPAVECEAARDMVRAYHDMVSILKSLKMRFSAMLLRHGIVWNERSEAGNLRSTWSRAYIAWARKLSLGDPLEDETLKLYLTEVLDGIEKCTRLKVRCSELANTERFKPYVDALTRLKGVDELTALAYVSMMGDFARFRNGRSVSAYFGLIPGRHDSGEKRGNNSSMTKAGDTTVRRAVIEGLAGLPHFGGAHKWQRKGHEVSNDIEAEALKCNARNYNRYHRLVKKGKKANVAKVAVASELVQQMWVLGRMVDAELA